ncbi:MAG: hypothetical protein NVS9B7_05300 [Flavisolibacter sp.]
MKPPEQDKFLVLSVTVVSSTGYLDNQTNISYIKNWGNDRKDDSAPKQLTTILLVIYLVVLFWILLFKLGVHFSNMGKPSSINLIPFRRPPITNGKVDFSERILNVMIFVPLGLYAGILFIKWVFVKKFFLFVFVSLIIEALQFILRLGVADITDVITNTLGGIIGLGIFIVIKKLFKNELKAHKFTNTIAAIGTALIIIFLLLLKTN